MVSFEGFAMDGSGPIYGQIVTFIKRGAAAQKIRDGDEMPSRRVLSALLGVNPNTVQKAYRMLEEEGLIQSRSGVKSFVTLTEEQRQRVRAELIESDAKAVVSAMKQMGLSKGEALLLIDRLWECGADDCKERAVETDCEAKKMAETAETTEAAEAAEMKGATGRVTESGTAENSSAVEMGCTKYQHKPGRLELDGQIGTVHTGRTGRAGRVAQGRANEANGANGADRSDHIGCTSRRSHARRANRI